MKKIFENEDYFVSYRLLSVKKLKEIEEEIVKFCVKYKAFTGESLWDNDDAHTDSCDLLCELVDNIFKFNIKYSDDT